MTDHTPKNPDETVIEHGPWERLRDSILDAHGLLEEGDDD